MLRAIAFLEDTLPAVLMAIMTVVMVSEVFSRYVLGHSIIWAAELVTIAFIWQVYLGSIAVMRRRRHIAVEITRKWLSGRALAIFDVMSLLVVCGALTFTGWQAYKFIAHTNFSLLPASGLSRRVLVDAVLIGCSGMLAHALIHLAAAISGALTGRYLPESGSLGQVDDIEQIEPHR